MSDAKSKFEEIIGDVDAFQLMLDGAFKDWVGSYDVLVLDTQEYLFTSKTTAPSFRPFCRKLRSIAEGEKLCWKCDQDAAERVKHEQKPIIYTCHAGLTDIAVPILIKGELVATVFCGQARSTEELSDQKGLAQATELENELGFAPNELTDLWHRIPRISEFQIRQMSQRIENLVYYVTQIGHERLDLKRAHAKDQRRLQESLAVEFAARDLSKLAETWDQFWQQVEQVLEQVCSVIGASAAMLVALSDKSDQAGLGWLVPRAITGLPVEPFKGRSYSPRDELLDKVIAQNNVEVVPFEQYRDPSTICGSISQYAPHQAKTIDQVVLTKVQLDDQHNGLLLFFMNRIRDTEASLPIEEEKSLFRPLTFLISAAYHNCSLYQQRKQELEQRRRWLRHLTHQLIAPLHGLQGYAEDAWGRLISWKRDGSQNVSEWSEDKTQRWSEELRRWENSFDWVVWLARYTARLASNLSWTVYGRPEALDLSIVSDVGGLLIQCARDFQGIARERGLRKVNVETSTVAPMDGRICVNDNLFRQAAGNLLDNAVKYSTPGTDINIVGEFKQDMAIIRVVNYGIQLREGDVEKVFEDGYRTAEAQQANQTGTGIGLPVAREIIGLHGGTLTALPSKHTRQGWRTEFIISLPLRTQECDQEVSS